MYGKIQIMGDIEVVTGMHIGGSTAFAAIGAVDSPVVRDARTNQPMIPGSSLKGKMRSLLAKACNEALAKTPDDDDIRLTRLFGTAKKGKVSCSRLLVSDMLLKRESVDSLRNQGLGFTEIKFENTINRLTAVANPRQIERVIRGVEFGLDMIYEVRKEAEEAEIEEDFQTLAYGMRLLQYDYIGGHGSRGYGKIKFRNVLAESVVGDLEDSCIQKANDILCKELSK